MTQHSWNRDEIAGVIAKLQHKPGALLPILHGIQNKLGYIPPEAVPMIAEGLNLSRADVHGTISFYHFFRTTPPGRHTLHICRAEACQAMNSKALETHAKQRLGIDFHETDPSGFVTLEPVYCLGNCACSPSVLIDGALHSRVTPERFDELLENLQENAL